MRLLLAEISKFEVRFLSDAHGTFDYLGPSQLADQGTFERLALSCAQGARDACLLYGSGLQSGFAAAPYH